MQRPAGSGPHAAPRGAPCNVATQPLPSSQLWRARSSVGATTEAPHLMCAPRCTTATLQRISRFHNSLSKAPRLAPVLPGASPQESRAEDPARRRSMLTHTILRFGAGVAAGLLAVACSDQPNVNMAPKRPSFWVTPPPAQCPTGKWTGGGRIDPPSNPDTPDEAVHPEYFAVVLPPMTGKFTFGFNVFLGQDADGNCIVNKGEIEVNGHAQKIAWHVAIHDGVDAYDGRPVHATVFSDAHPGGYCLVVGIPDDYMTARENGKGSTEPYELAQFEVCDNDRGRPQKGKPGPDAMR